jgi:precorrin-3B synthase
MMTGDGLLARLMPSASIPLETMISLCEASERHGNGIVEVTQRGSLQIRGLSPLSAPRFAHAAVSLRLGMDGETPILTSPLTGMDLHEYADLGALTVAVRDELSRLTGRDALGPKVSVLIDGGGRLHLDEVLGDVRVQAGPDTRLHISLAGTAATSTSLGWVEPYLVPKAVAHVLAAIAQLGSSARARDLINAREIEALRRSLAEVYAGEPPPRRARPEPIGRHPLKNGRLAVGIALPFGFTHAALLKRVTAAAGRWGARDIRLAPGRALLALDLTAKAADGFVAAAAAEDLIVAADDPRRHVVACAGAPACASATLATRELAPLIAHAAKSLLSDSFTVHVSGCAKGCAHAGAAELTLVGPDRIIVMGRACARPDGFISPKSLISGLARLRCEQADHLDLMPKLGTTRVLEILGAVPARE